MHRPASVIALVLAALAGCDVRANDDARLGDDAPGGPPWFNDAGVPYCWNYTCPGDPEATECGTCTAAGHDVECPPGFVCSCSLSCVKGPRSYDGGILCDAGTTERPDAMVHDWPACDLAHPPGT